MRETAADSRDDTPQPAEGPLPEAETGQLATRPRGTDACTHLGLDQDPFVHYDQPSPDHRCYLWMQRDRIDLAHQEMFCLTGFSENCPWLSINLPGQKRVARLTASGERASAPAAMAGEAWYSDLGLALQNAASTAGRGLAAAAAGLGPALLQLGIWLWLALRMLGRALISLVSWLSHQYRPLERAVLRGLAFVGRQLWKGVLWAWGQLSSAGEKRPSVPQPPPRVEASPSSVPKVVEARVEASEYGYLRQGMEAVRDGDQELALTCFRKATEVDEKDEQAWLWRGALAESTEEKAESFRRALTLNPYNARARAGLVQLGLAAEAVFAEGVEPKPSTEALAEQIGAAPEAPELEDLAVTWDCPGCAYVNPRSASTCQRCGRPSPRLERELGSRDGFLKGGLDAMKAGNEELAYHYFSLAAETDPTDEKAWYWRAKTAPTLDELIRCLKHILEVNPDNAKVKSDLDWALKRQQREQARLAKAQAEGPMWRQTVLPRLVAPARRALVQVASVCAFLLALLICLPYAVNLTDLPTVPEYQSYLSLLPRFELPAMPVWFGADSFDLGAALPLVLALLLFQAAFNLGDGGGLGTRIWTALLGAAAVALMALYVANPSTTSVGYLLAIAAILAALVGDARARWEPAQRTI